jgi:RNase adapter protein RapZ
MKLVIVSGLSGAGKTVALKQYEDLGYYCIDNLPLGLLGPLSLRALHNRRYAKLAVGVDARASPREIARFQNTLARQRKRGVDAQVLFLTASDAVILRRYHETRRKHPLTSARLSLSEAIQRERELLYPIADVADVTIDTTGMNLHTLREELRLRQPDKPGRMSLVLLSFGYKNGIPPGADYVFDVRCLPNPHWIPKLSARDGRHKSVARFLEKDPRAAKMAHDIRAFLERWLPAFEREDRAYATVAVGCTGGRHRSVYVVERLAQAFKGRYEPVVVKHKELG